MSNWMKNTRTWLGLGNEPYYEDEYGEPGDEYDEYDDEDYVDDEPASRSLAARAPRCGAPGLEVRPVRSASSPAARTGTRATAASA